MSNFYRSIELNSDELESVKVSPIRVDETYAGSLYSVPQRLF